MGIICQLWVSQTGKRDKQMGQIRPGIPKNQRRPPLSVAIKSILSRYPDGQIFKEIIQNADDAGARVVRFYLDHRQHGRSFLVHPDVARFQGPALLAYNDAQFRGEDWESIQNLQVSKKAENPFKVGKFGIGFNSVYHITVIMFLLKSTFVQISDFTNAIYSQNRNVYPILV
ncbi:hypothetical protein EMCRGX_G019164 [Ephydatia muelleri]